MQRFGSAILSAAVCCTLFADGYGNNFTKANGVGDCRYWKGSLYVRAHSQLVSCSQ
jgi:hypothetical protein